MFRLRPGIKSDPVKRWNLAGRVFFACGACHIPLPQDAPASEARSRTYDGLWLREPGQFLHDALPLAQAFLARFEAAAVRRPRGWRHTPRRNGPAPPDRVRGRS
jgi:hypothetical protein